MLVSGVQQSESVSHSVVFDFVTPWTVARQSPLSMAFSWQEYWSGLPFPSPGDLLHPGIEPVLQADSLPTEPPGKPILFHYGLLQDIECSSLCYTVGPYCLFYI